MHEVLVNRLGGLSLPRKSVVRLTDRPDMTLDVYRGRKTTIQQFTIVFVLIFLKGIASGKRVEAHIIVKRYSLQDMVFGNGPTQSIMILLKD